MEEDSRTDLCIENLEEGADDKLLLYAFISFGTITHIKITRKNGCCKGYVRFSSPKSAYKALLEMNGKVIGLNTVSIFLIPRVVHKPVDRFQQQLRLMYLSCCSNIPPPSLISQLHASKILIMQEQLSGIQGSTITTHGQSNRRREMLVARLHSLVYDPYPRASIEITGILLQTDNSGLVQLLSHQKYLERKVKEAFATLREYTKNKSFLIKQKIIMRQEILSCVKDMNSDVATELVEIFVYSTNAFELLGLFKRKELLKEKVENAAIILEGYKARAAAEAQIPKQELGEALYPLVYDIYPTYAGKITGMLLERDNSELLQLLGNKYFLKAKADLAFLVWRTYVKQQEMKRRY